MTPDSSPLSAPRLAHLCTGVARPLAVAGRVLSSAIVKTPVAGAVEVGPLGLAGDEQADLAVHGGLSKAVYAYPLEHMPFWQAERHARGLSAADAPLPPGFMGENLGVRGLLEDALWVGDTLHFDGSACVLRVSAPREPCAKFTAVMGFAQAGRLMVQQARCGFYLAVQTPGALRAGMAVQVRAGSRGLSVADAIRAKWARHRN